VGKRKKENNIQQSSSPAPQQKVAEATSSDAGWEIAALKLQLAEKEKDAAVNQDKYLRAIAEFDDYKKLLAKVGDDLKAKLEKKEKEAAENHKNHLAAKAEFEDYKKHAIKAKDDTKEKANDISAEEKDLMAGLEAKEKEAAANYDKYLRAVAELDNYKKRSAREKADIIKYGKEDVIKDVLPFMDSLDRALEHAEGNADIQAFKKGIQLIQDQLLSCLKKHGVERIDCTGAEFDPNFHEAMMQVDSKAHAHNKVINEFERGYLLNGRLLRPSKVSVCKKINKENNICEQIVEKGQ
jgi:molecular chaperone GrpE